MKYLGIRWVEGDYPRSVDVLELTDIEPTTLPRLVQHQVLLPNGGLYGIATCRVTADESSATLDYGAFEEANAKAQIPCGVTELRLTRSSTGVTVQKVLWRSLGEAGEIEAKFEIYEPHSQIPNKSHIDVAQLNLETSTSGLSDPELEASLPKPGSLPAKISAVTTAYARNPYVIEATLRRSGWVCEDCGKTPFISARTGRPYLEVHHVIPLSEDGADSMENTIALCPTCHRERHHGLPRQPAS